MFSFVDWENIRENESKQKIERIIISIELIENPKNGEYVKFNNDCYKIIDISYEDELEMGIILEMIGNIKHDLDLCNKINNPQESLSPTKISKNRKINIID